MSLIVTTTVGTFVKMTADETLLKEFVAAQLPNATPAQQIKQVAILEKFVDELSSSLNSLESTGRMIYDEGTKKLGETLQKLNDQADDLVARRASHEVKTKEKKAQKELAAEKRVAALAEKKALTEKRKQLLKETGTAYAPEETRSYAEALKAKGKTFYTDEQKAAFKAAKTPEKPVQKGSAFTHYSPEERVAYQEKIAKESKHGKYFSVAERTAHKAKIAEEAKSKTERKNNASVTLPRTEKHPERRYFWKPKATFGVEAKKKLAGAILLALKEHFSSLSEKEKEDVDKKSLALLKSVLNGPLSVRA
jgi:hypothetical protein